MTNAIDLATAESTVSASASEKKPEEVIAHHFSTALLPSLPCIEVPAPKDIAKNQALIGGYAYQIIAQQSQQMSKLRSQVLADTDIEPLHQMRITTRRLRSALILFSEVICVGETPLKDASKMASKSVSKKIEKTDHVKLVKAVKKLTQALGMVRDLDVMQAWFEEVMITHHKKAAHRLSKKEKQAIQTLLKKLKKRRKKQFPQLEKMLKGSAYKKLTRQFKQWVKRPKFSPLAQETAHRSAAQSIIEPVTDLLKHAGWQMATQTVTHQGNAQIIPIADISLAQLNQHLQTEGERLHDLRKQIKRVRYQTEFFRGLYGLTYAAQVREFRTLQKILGQLQDQLVISEFLTTEIGPDWTEKLPTIEADFQQSRLALWQTWQPYQLKYLKLHSALVTDLEAA